MEEWGLGGGRWGWRDPRRQPGCYSSPLCVDVLVLCTHVASCISGWSSAHVSSDMCVHVHLHMSACQGIKKDRAGGCEIRERARGLLGESLQAWRLSGSAGRPSIRGSVERAKFLLGVRALALRTPLPITRIPRLPKSSGCLECPLKGQAGFEV